MDEFLEVDEDELLTFESELIKRLKRDDFVAELNLDSRCRRLRARVMAAVEEASSTSSDAALNFHTNIITLPTLNALGSKPEIK